MRPRLKTALLISTLLGTMSAPIGSAHATEKVRTEAHKNKAEPVVRTTNPRNETVYWVGAAGAAQDAGEGTDFHATAHGYASITPLQIDLTHVAQMAPIRDWLGA